MTEQFPERKIFPDLIRVEEAEFTTLTNFRELGLSEDHFLLERIRTSRGIPYGEDSPDVIVELPDGKRRYRLVTKKGDFGTIVRSSSH